MKTTLLTVLIFTSLMVMSRNAQAGPDKKAETYWTKFPKPEIVYVIDDPQTLPALYPGDPGGNEGSLNFTMQSLAGLAAKSVKDGSGKAMIWTVQRFVNHRDIDDRKWLDKILTETGARREDVKNPFDLLRMMAHEGIVKGTILYSADHGPKEGTPKDVSVNVATTMAGVLGGVIVESRAEGRLSELGLKPLGDARGHDSAWCLKTYGKKLSKDMVFMPPVRDPYTRDMSVAARCLCMVGTTTKALQIACQWARPNTLVNVGWPKGTMPEDKLFMMVSRYGHFNPVMVNKANMPVMSCLAAGKDIPYAKLQVNGRSHVDPLKLSWAKDSHLTTFLMSDGDCLCWFIGDFVDNWHHSFWSNKRRGSFAMGWTSPSIELEQLAVSNLEYFARSATANDQFVLQANFYTELYGRALKSAGKEYDQLIVDQIAPSMQKLNVRVLSLINPHWNGENTRQVYESLAQKIPGLVGIMAIQYAPGYNSGQGSMIWVKNREGVPIPVLSARYQIWNHQAMLENSGTPAFIASKINAAPHQGAMDNLRFFDWTSVHAWSWFKPAGASMDPWAEEMDQFQTMWPSPRAEEEDQNKIDRQFPGAEYGLAPVGWCVDRLAPYVKTVTPEELLWQMRLHLKTRETLDGLAAEMLAAPDMNGGRNAKIQEYRQWLAGAQLDRDEQRQAAFEKFKALGTEPVGE